jgi:hypothetical protein
MIVSRLSLLSAVILDMIRCDHPYLSRGSVQNYAAATEIPKMLVKSDETSAGMRAPVVGSGRSHSGNLAGDHTRAAQTSCLQPGANAGLVWETSVWERGCETTTCTNRSDESGESAKSFAFFVRMPALRFVA